MLLKNVVQKQYLKMKKKIKYADKNMINVLQNIKNVPTIIKNLHKEKNVKTKNVVFIKKNLKKYYHLEKNKELLLFYQFNNTVGKMDVLSEKRFK
jgi:hypothetical protein